MARRNIDVDGAATESVSGPSSSNSPKKKQPGDAKSTSSTTLVKANAQSLIRSQHRESLAAWFELYIKLNGGSENTIQAKARDLQRLLDYLTDTAGTDHPDQWTRAITKGFLTWLEKQRGEKPATVNRRLATLKHAAGWIHRQREFLAGMPTSDVPFLEEDDPDWQGLTDIQVTRLRSAGEQLIAMKKGTNQRPRRDYAFFIVLLRTGLRCSELLSLDLSNYEGKHLHNIRRKGKKRTRKKFLATEARQALDDYIEHERGTDPGPLFLSNRAKRWSRSKSHDALKSIERQANANLPDDQRISFSAHIERHTYLRKTTEKFGVQYAKQESGNVTDRHLWRYVRPSEQELEQAQEDLF